MRELNIEFQEQYKQLDKLCREMYPSGEGVSAYIQEMECTPCNEQIIVDNWDAVYKQVKHLRWMRNNLAHEISIDTDFCTQSDIDWVKQFYDSILNGTDPLARIQIAKQQTKTKKPTPTIAAEEKQCKSLWNRIASKIKNWFS